MKKLNISNNERYFGLTISIAGFPLNELMMEAINKDKDLIVMRVLHTAFSGLMRDYTDAIITGDLSILIKYWDVSVGEEHFPAEYKDKLNKLREWLVGLDETNNVEPITWPDFNKI